MNNSAGSTILRDLRRSWPGWLISLVSLVVVFAVADFEKLRDALAYAEYVYFIPSIAVFLMAIVTRAFAWRTLLEESVSVKQTIFALGEGYLLNNLLPFRLGEFGRGILLSRTANISFLRVMSSIVIERVFDLSIVVGILLISLVYVVGATEWAQPVALAMAAVLVAALLFLHLIARSRERSLRWFAVLQKRFSPLRRIRTEHLDRFFQGLSALTDLRRFLIVAGLLALTWLLIVYHYYLVLIAFFPGGKFLWAAFGIGVVGLGVAVPSAPGSIGVVQGVIVGVFPALFGLDPSIALAYSITVHGIYLVVTSSLGVWGLIRDGQSLGRVYEQVRALLKREKGGSVGAPQP